MSAASVSVLSPRREHEERTLERLTHHLGPEALAILCDENTVELSCNPDGFMWWDRAGSKGMEKVGWLPPHQIELFINSVASFLGVVIDRDVNPTLSGELPPDPPWRGARIQALVRPAVSGPCFSIRMHAMSVFTLEDYERSKIITTPQKECIEDAVCNRDNILIAGATKSGKSTLMNAILANLSDVHPDDRLGIVEDTYELKVRSKNKFHLHTTKTVTMNDHLKICMRMRPNGIMVGEVRGGEVLSYIKAIGTGHYGYCTIHAATAVRAIRRVEDLIREIPFAVPSKVQIADSINLIVVIKYDDQHPASRHVTEIVRLLPELSSSGDYVFEPATGIN
ncbi:CpaF Flp pilus assembly protein, ATPase CpaF [uncultured Caudovirales phage]|uniref:CpaF Flp pilus assembly protein, ATPase CpaF n=1 Tax=uncultured Caudovirales phage TaxID=2100421 RepID=A0A6J5RD46_9CAUD|nr:CpaF Flp pilus assembly protein, ATPase CpaF [uncultured Caudovirales phage]